MDALLKDAVARATGYLEGIPKRSIAPTAEAVARLAAFDVPLQDEPVPAERVLAELDELGSPATVASNSGRYFGFVIGASLPVTTATTMLAAAWDQCAGLEAASPVVARIEEVCRKWLLSLLRLPEHAGAGFVTGATMANFAGLAAARGAVLERAGWDVESDGLCRAPAVTVIVGDEVHVSVLKSLGMLGLGRRRVVRLPVDDQGRMRPDALPAIDGPTILCMQSGNVNTGAFDPALELCSRAKAAGAWVHVDGAFGLWARACPPRARLATGIELADSWATDAHKWLNVPYDSGIVFVRESRYLRTAMGAMASYLIEGDGREPNQYTPELSRRARGVEIWAALRSLGRDGLATMIERHCRQAARFAHGLREAGHQVLNEVALNQVLVSFGDADATRRVIRAIQDEGICWCSGTEWQGRTAMRLSVSSWATTDDDVERSLDSILRAARRHA